MVNPNLWGPHGWKFIHYTALGYPINPSLQQKNNYKFFFTNLQNILPCKLCQDHFSKNIRDLPIDNYLESRDTLFKWTVDIHNQTNREYNKKIYTYDEAFNLYTKNYYERFDYIYAFIIILLLIIILYYLYNK
tara:strand:+ start:2693 stop:3091 length:399 start_codon:yes stop_codon:yes gene_type:complete